jgi:hypothetical protein
VWLAEQRAASLGEITITVKPSLSGLVGSQPGSSPSATSTNKVSIPTLNIGYAQVVGPSVAAGIAVSALFYSKAVTDLKRSEQIVRKNNVKLTHS